MSERTLSVKKKFEPYLMGIKGVKGVAVNGSIVVYVEKATPELLQVIPKEVDGVQVRVKETGRVSLLSIKPMAAIFANRVGRWRPAPGGVSIGHPQVTAGTLTCCAIDRGDGKLVGLSNNHVVALNWGSAQIGKVGDPILQPGPYDGGINPTDKIGELLRWSKVSASEDNTVDAAVFKSDLLRKDVLDVGKPSQSKEPYLGMNVVKSGRSSGVTFGKVTGVNATISVDDEEFGTCIFKDQIVIEPPILVGGDSGSWIGEVDSFESVGLGFAGSDVISVANKAILVEEMMNLTIIPPLPKIGLAAMVAMWGGILGVGAVLTKGGRKNGKAYVA